MDENLKIAICEDEEVSRKLTLGLIHKIEQEVNIESFTDGSSFLSEFYRGKYDLILMDIFMPGITGVETVKRIRKIDDTVPITFLTSSAEHALDGYKYHVDRYLIKPIQAAQLKEVLEFAHEVLHKSSISIICDRKEVFVPLSSIIYLEQTDHYVIFHLTEDRDLITTGKITALLQNLPSPDFVQCHQSYCVNIRKATHFDIELRTLTMENGGIVYIRRQDVPRIRALWDEIHSPIQI